MVELIVCGTRTIPRSGAARAVTLLILLSGAVPTAAYGQQGVAVRGQVVDATNNMPIPTALVELQTMAGEAIRSTTTDANGRFEIRDVSAGTYTLVISSIGSERRRLEGMEVGSEPLNLAAIQLTTRAFELNPVVVTASRAPEKVLEAPASIHTVSTLEIQEQPATTPADYVRGLPGVDVVSNGLSQHNVVARGFNNVFSGALFVLTDHRWASVPSLRFNAYNLIPQTSEDIERIEFVLGPASALYGPNVDKGVMHIITKSPLQSQETIVSVTGGERELFQGAIRHSGLLGSNVGYKISGQYFRGMDWRFTDPVEAQNDSVASQCLADYTLANAACRAFSPDPATLPDTDRLERIGTRDFQQERFSGSGRLDFRVTDASTLTVEGGATSMGSSVEMTGIGAAQAKNWTYWYGQARFTRDNLFAQAYINLSNAGDTYTLRAGDAIADNSLLYVGQVQHATDLSDRQRFVYGADVIRTVPRTGGSITGQNEGDDDISEFGVYLQSETAVSPRLDLVAAGRLDYHSVVDDIVLSPRAGAVIKPSPGQNFRFTYNRAFSQPTTNNLFLDIEASPTLGPFTDYAVRATGVPSTTGFTFRRDCGPGGSTLCMRSPFQAGFLPYNQVSDAIWQGAIDQLKQLVQAGRLPALGTTLDPRLEATLRGMDVSGAPVGTVLRELDPTSGGFSNQTMSPNEVVDVDPIQPTITNTLEVGYKGIIADRMLVSVDVYYTRIQDFIGPLLVETPNAFLNPGPLSEFIGPELADSGYAAIAPLVVGGLANAPLGTVAPEQAPNPAAPWDLFVTYRNFGEVDLWGTDLSATYLLTDEISLSASYSFVHKNFFENLAGVSDVALNAPINKGSFRGQYRSQEAGISAELQGRYVDSFPVNSGVYIGHISSYVLFDGNLGYRIPGVPGTDVTLSAYNIFDNRHRQMVGAPELGRILLLRLRYNF